MRKWFCLLLSLGMYAFVSCKDGNKSFAEGYENAQNDAEVAQEEKVKNAPKIYAFDGGSIRVNNKNLFAQDNTYKGDTITLADAFYVIKHPNGILVWDTGLPERLVGKDSVTTADGAFKLFRRDSITTQLAKIGVKPEDVNYIGLSHIHFDHTGGASHFDKATWLVQKRTLDFMESDSIIGNSFYEPESLVSLSEKKVINGDYDVFEDGSVVIKYLPGHTAGHQALYIDLGQSDPVVLSGDIYHFRKNRAGGIVPQINYNIQESQESLKKFEEFVKSKRAKVYIQHDMQDFKNMTKAPGSVLSVEKTR